MTSPAGSNVSLEEEGDDDGSIVWDPNQTLNDGKLYAIVKKYPSMGADDLQEELDPIELDLDAEEIDLNHSRVVTMRNFVRLTQPRFLGLRNNLLSNIEGLNQMVNLRELELYITKSPR